MELRTFVSGNTYIHTYVHMYIRTHIRMDWTALTYISLWMDLHVDGLMDIRTYRHKFVLTDEHTYVVHGLTYILTYVQ